MKDKFDRTALIGTSADPPTCGHESLFVELTKIFPKVITWASDNPNKSHHICLEKRHKLLEALVESINSPRFILEQEISSPLTINTIEKAKSKWPKSRFTFVIGSDLNHEILHWHQIRNIVKEVRIAIAPRVGWPIKEIDINALIYIGAKVDILPVKIEKAASSEIRVSKETSMIPNSILDILLDKNLYGINQKQ